MLKDIIDGLKLVSDGIDSVITIAEAIKNGKDYIKAKHADVQKDLQLLVEELQKSLFIIKSTSAILTNFRFAISADVSGMELSRFNDYLIHSKAEAQHFENHIDDLRTHCSKIRKHAEKISGQASISGFTRIFAFLKLNSPQKEMELGQKLDKLAYEDYAVANSASNMLSCLVNALKDVQNALGIGGVMYPENVPKAASLLSSYASEFERMEVQSTIAIKTMHELINELS